MSTSVMTERIAEASPLFKARAAGVFWLMTVLLGGFAAFGGDKLVVSVDAATTATNILTHESLFRWAIVANLIATVCYLGFCQLLQLSPHSPSLNVHAFHEEPRGERSEQSC